MNDEIFKTVSKNINISPNVIEKVYKSFWLYIKQSIEKLPLKENLTDKEFSKLQTNYNIPSLGKLYCTIDKYKGIKNRIKLIKNFRDAKNK